MQPPAVLVSARLPAILLRHPETAGLRGAGAAASYPVIYRSAQLYTGIALALFAFLAVSVWCAKSLGGKTSSLAPVTPGGKSFALTSVETSARGKLAGVTRATVNQGLFSGSRRCAENVIPG